MRMYDTEAAKRPVNLTMNSDLVARARAEGLNLSALAEGAIAGEMARIARQKFDVDLEAAYRDHERYLEEFGSLSDAIRNLNDAPG